jgi:hypothetical protein
MKRSKIAAEALHEDGAWYPPFIEVMQAASMLLHLTEDI